jgi:hypothetical protein
VEGKACIPYVVEEVPHSWKKFTECGEIGENRKFYQHFDGRFPWLER